VYLVKRRWQVLGPQMYHIPVCSHVTVFPAGAWDEARRLQSWGSAALASTEVAHKRQGELDVVLRLRQSQVATMRTETAAVR
jgi:hypothetical protein